MMPTSYDPTALHNGDSASFATGTYTGTLSAQGLLKVGLSSFTNGRNTTGLQLATDAAAEGIEFITATASNGSGFRVSASAADGFRIQTRSASASFFDAFSFSLAGAFVAPVAQFGGATVGGTVSIVRAAAGTLLYGLLTDTTAGNTLASLQSVAVTGHTFGVAVVLNTTGVGFANYSQQNGSGPLLHHLLTVGAGDVQTSFEVNGVTTWSVGLDNSNSDRFSISKNLTLGADEYLGITTGGTVIIPGATVTGPNAISSSTGLESNGNYAFSIKAKNVAGDPTVALENNNGRIWSLYLATSDDSLQIYDWTAAQARLTISTAGNWTVSGSMTRAEGGNMNHGTTTGTKYGTDPTQKQAWWNATPVVQPAHIADPVGGTVIDAEARTAIAAINARDATVGLTAAA